MKKFFIVMAVFVAAVLGFISCEKEGAKLYEVLVTVNYPDGYTETTASGVTVTIVNTLTSQEDFCTTDDTGVGTIFLAEGTYTISASLESDDFYFSGITQDVVVLNTTNSFAIDLEASSKSGGLVFKEIYYTGSKTEAGNNYYSDQFHEIYNNSDEVIYLDGLCIGVLEPSGSTASVWVDDSGNIQDSLPVTYHALMFPGTGTQYPLEPRTSVVLAMDALDHQSDVTNGNSLSPVNLGNAQFETYIEAPGKDTDYAGAANLIVMYTTSSSMYDWIHSVNGAAAILFRLPTGLDYASYVNNANNFQTKPGTTSATQYFMVDKSCVIDAVECINSDVTKQNKRLPTSLDAGHVSCSGTYISKSIRRKVSMIIDGNVVYMDTNNSTNDFLYDCTPTPFVQPTAVDTK